MSFLLEMIKMFLFLLHSEEARELKSLPVTTLANDLPTISDTELYLTVSSAFVLLLLFSIFPLSQRVTSRNPFSLKTQNLGKIERPDGRAIEDPR